jgi:amidase
MHIYELSATEIVEKIKTRQLTCIEIATAFIERINKVNPSLNAIHQFDPARILAEAHQKDIDINDGKKLGKLYGLPISLKDAFYAPGFRGAKGSVTLSSNSPTDKAAVAVQRILAEGAIILGITNAPEFCAAFETDNLLNGRTNNPYDLNRVPGGSSGGEAALIAAGGSCLGLASDAGGSIRQPAHCTGIAGFKPTKGLIPTTGNVPNDIGGLHTFLLTFGPMARHVEDLELLLSVIAGADDGDPLSVPVILQPSASVDVTKLRVGYFLNNGVIAPDVDTTNCFRAAIDMLSPYVNSMVPITPPDIFKQTLKLVWDTCFLGGDKGQLLSQSFVKTGQTEFSPLYNQLLKQVHASSFDTTELKIRIMETYAYKKAFLELMKDIDILLCPVTASPARLHGTTHEHINDYTYVMMSNLTGAPAISINSGFSADGLPIGLQIIAKPWQDHVVLAFAKKAQAVLGIPNIVNV